MSIHDFVNNAAASVMSKSPTEITNWDRICWAVTRGVHEGHSDAYNLALGVLRGTRCDGFFDGLVDVIKEGYGNFTGELKWACAFALENNGAGNEETCDIVNAYKEAYHFW
ncbi:MAG: hypothetical protein KJ592_01485 [Nanoarchaeota archaeon]|nr:hypothetical protein [Nanoarchaeota archaeon]